jgi:hypothetical protein
LRLQPAERRLTALARGAVLPGGGRHNRYKSTCRKEEGVTMTTTPTADQLLTNEPNQSDEIACDVLRQRNGA